MSKFGKSELYNEQVEFALKEAADLLKDGKKYRLVGE